MNRPGDWSNPKDPPAPKTYPSAAVASEWARAVIGTSYVPMTRPEVEQLLNGLVQKLQALLDTEPFAPEGGREVGARLVDAHFTNPQTLSRTITTLLTVPQEMSGSVGGLRGRWPMLVAEAAEGYAAKLVDRVRREQQEIIAAAFTAREQAEQALRESQSQLEQARADFITTVSHELRTPLTPIKGYLHTLLAKGEAIDADRRAVYYQVMLGQAEQLEGLVDDLLAAAALEHAQFNVSAQVVDVAEVIERALANVPPDSARRFSWRRDDSAVLAVCDPVRLQQVIANLLSNADKYSPAGQSVQVSARRNGDAVEIVVHDFGSGIPADLADAVFEPFRRLGHSPTPGAGLGLHIARRLTESMNGRIWVDVDSRPGASFHVTVPAAPAVAPSPGSCRT